MRVEILYEGARMCAGETAGDRIVVDETFDGWSVADEIFLSTLVLWREQGIPVTTRSIG